MTNQALAYGFALALAGVLLLCRPLGWRAGVVSTMPWQVYRLATNPRLRRNHALEHATLHVLTQRYGKVELSGSAVRAGFVLRGWINPEDIIKAAQEGLERLKSGEHGLAYHPSCGTTIGTAEFVTWLVLGFTLLYTGRLTPATLLAVLGMTWVAGPWLGRIVQRKLTTSVDVGHLAITGVTIRQLPAQQVMVPVPGSFWGEAVVLTELSPYGTSVAGPQPAQRANGHGAGGGAR